MRLPARTGLNIFLFD